MAIVIGATSVKSRNEAAAGLLAKGFSQPIAGGATLAAIAEAVTAKRVFELEHRVRRVDGTLGWTLSRAVPLLDERGEIIECPDISTRPKPDIPILLLQQHFA